MRRFIIAFATIASFAMACGQGASDMTTSGANPGRSTIGMFLSRTSSISFKDGDVLASACAADVQKSCGTLQAGDGFVRRLTACLRTNESSLSTSCRDAIKKMRHDKDGDDACAGACACGQTCVGDDDDHHDKDSDKDKGKGGKSLRAVTASTSSHDAKHDEDHDDDDLRCEGACPAGMVSCHGKCVNLDNDPLNCGYCDNECPGKLGDPCVKRQCQKACKGHPGLTDCGEVCADTKNDPNNCGSCGLACGCGQVCTAGFCVTPAACGFDGAACTTGNPCCAVDAAGNPTGLVCLAGVCGIPG